MKKFYQKIDTRSKKAMVDFLTNHFRYNTMSSWNASTSYANCVKITHLDLTREQLSKAWEMLDMPEIHDNFGLIIDEFSRENEYQWQIGFNGKSNGYLVLYKGGLNYENAKTARCDFCGRLTFHEQDTPCTRTGCKGTLKFLAEPIPTVYSLPGQSVDMDKDFEDWSMDDLRNRVKLVQRFDEVCDNIVDSFVYFCDNFSVAEEEVQVSKKVKVLQENVLQEA